MSEDSPGRGRRAATEFIVIVVGVLMALWIDAGWAWLQDRSEERRLRADLVEEFRENLAILEDLERTRRDQVVRMLAALMDGVADLPADSIAPTLAATVFSPTFNPRRGALEAAISGANLGLIRSHELRKALSGWDGLLEDAQEEIEWMVPVNLELARAVESDWLAAMGGAMASAPDNEAGRALLRRIYSDPTLRNLVAIRMTLTREGQGEREALISETRRIIELAEGEP